jgi:hypothetical protein
MSNLVVSNTAQFTALGSNVILGTCNLSYYLSKVATMNSFDGASNTFLGNITTNSNLYVKGEIQCQGNISTSNDIHVEGSGYVNQDLYVTGTTYLGQTIANGACLFSSPAFFESEVRIVGEDTYVDGCNLTYFLDKVRNMQDPLNLSDPVLCASSNAFYENVNTTIEETLLTKSNLIVEGNLLVKGTCCFQGVHLTNTSLSQTTIDGLNVSGQATIDSSIINHDLTVLGNTTLCNNLVVNGPTTMTAPLISHNVISAQSNLIVKGETTLSNVVNCYGKINMYDSFTVMSNLNISANASVKNNLAVGGLVTFCNNTLMNSNLLVKGITTLSNDTKFYGTLRLPRQGGSEWSILTSVNSNNMAYSDLVFKSLNNTAITFTDDFQPELFNFTGKHRCSFNFENAEEKEDMLGKIVVANGKYKNLENSDVLEIDEAIPIVEIASTNCDPRVFGVISGFEEDNMRTRMFKIGNIQFKRAKSVHDIKVLVNSLGEGCIRVCSKNGNFENGDLITTCEIAGYGCKQGDNIVRNHTMAKITTDIDWDAEQCLERYKHGIITGVDGQLYKWALVGCIYLC